MLRTRPEPAPMRASDAAVLLGAAAAIDNRVVSDTTAKEWGRALAGLGPDECLAALRTFRRTRPGVYLEPGHIRELVRIVRDEQHAREATRRGLPTGPLATAEQRAAARKIARDALLRRRADCVKLATEATNENEEQK